MMEWSDFVQLSGLGTWRTYGSAIIWGSFRVFHFELKLQLSALLLQIPTFWNFREVQNMQGVQMTFV
jgi:hypothetical protein